MEFRELPDRPDHPRYVKRLRDIDSLLRQRKERLVEEGMLMDRATAEDDFWWFCRRFTPFETYFNEEKNHPLKGELWIDQPFLFWLCRQFQEQYVEPPDGWVWFEIHRKGFKTTLLLDSFLWLLARDPTDTIGLWTHKAEDIGAGMGRGLIHQLQTNKLRDHWPQFRNLQEGTKLGFTVDRPAGPRDQSVTILSIATSTVSLHPKRFALDDVESDKTYNNPALIATVSANISKIALMQHPGSTFTVCNTPWDESGPLMSRARDAGFAKVVCQRAMEGGDFAPAGTPNLHTKAFFERVRRDTKDDALYYRQMEFRFDNDQSVQFDRSWLVNYSETPEEIAKASPYIHFIVDGAKGTKHSDFAVIRVITWTAHDRWANLELVRERVGVSAIMQILLGRDDGDATSGWIERYYCPRGVGLVEKWMRVDPKLTLWFDDQGNTDWVGIFKEMIRLRGVRFTGGKIPEVKPWPSVHRSRESTKLSLIEDMDSHYQQGHAAYPAAGFGHGSFKGLLGEDRRDTRKQFEEDEYLRKRLGDLPPHDDMLDTEAQLGLRKMQEAMRRPKKGVVYTIGGQEMVRPTTRNPWGIPGGEIALETGMEGKTWLSL